MNDVLLIGLIILSFGLTTTELEIITTIATKLLRR